jgi:hypothetical protein
MGDGLAHPAVWNVGDHGRWRGRMSSGRFDLTVGTDLWFEGALWRVHRIDSRWVELVSDRTATRVPFDRLLAEGRPVNEAEPRDTDEELVPVILGSLTDKQRDALEVHSTGAPAVDPGPHNLLSRDGRVRLRDA